MDDFDSSDIDFGEPDIDPSDRSIGQKSIDAIIANATQDRITSKRTVKHLQFWHGAPSTRAKQKLWVKRFEAFREHTLGNDPTVPFTGLEVIRFFDSIISKMSLPLFTLYPANGTPVAGKLKPANHDKPAPSVVTVVKAFETIVDYGVFTWSEKDGYHMTRQDASQFRAFLDDAVKAGRLIKGSWCKRTWIGFLTLSRMVRAYIEYCLTKGCGNWDLVVAKSLSVTLISALGARSGDVTRSDLYHGTQFLQYQEIELYVDGQAASFENLRAVVTLTSMKGHKDRMNDDAVFYLRPLNDPEHHHICPITWLLVHVLRNGLVFASTLTEVLDRAFARPDHKVEWKHPRYPVLAAFTHIKPVKCDLEKPAVPHQPLATIKEMGLVSNILCRVYIHATRLGAIREVAHLPPPTNTFGLTTDGHRQIMGHQNQRATENYVGGHTMEVFNERAANKARKHRREPCFSTESAMDTVKAPVTQQEIQDWDERNESREGHTRDLSQNGVKMTIRRNIRRERLARFKENAIPENRFEQKPRPQNLVALAEISGSAMNASRSNLSRAYSLPPSGSTVTPTIVENRLDPRPSVSTVTPTAVESNLDPTLEEDLDQMEVSAAELEHLQDTLFPSRYGLDEESMPGPTNTGIDEEAERLLLGVEYTAENVTSETFIDTYARINVVRNSIFGSRWMAFKKTKSYETTIGSYSVRGNSRDEPSPWFYRCQKTPGCLFQTLYLGVIRKHHVMCKESLNVVHKPTPRIQCTHEGCTKTFASQKTLTGHVKSTHSWTPKPCDYGCEQITSYVSREMYSRHLRLVHTGLWPTRCRFLDCKHQDEFNTLEALYEHLIFVHKLTDSEERRQYYPQPLSRKVWVPAQPCVFVGCKSGRTCFRERHRMVDHLTRIHKMAKEAAIALIEEKGQYENRAPGDTGAPPPPSYQNKWDKKQPCIVDECSGALTFPKRSTMVRHLTGRHRLPKEEANALIDVKARFESVLIPTSVLGKESRKRSRSPE